MYKTDRDWALELSKTLVRVRRTDSTVWWLRKDDADRLVAAGDATYLPVN
jgi:hypothetical protein